MKKLTIAMALALSLTTAGAHAGVLRCTKAGETPETAPSYLLVLNLSADKAAIFTDAAGGGTDWELQYSEARTVMAMDGGPLNIVGTDTTKVNWRKERGCFKFMKGTLSFRLNLSSRGSTGEMRLLPNIQVKPGTAGTCSIPRPMVPAPVELTCDEL